MTTLCTLNANGIRAAHKHGFLDWLERKQPDVLCLQEVRAQRDQVGPELLSPVGYNSRWFVADKKGYAGVAIYSKKPVDSYHVGCGLDWADSEGRMLRADFEDFSIISMYLPSGSSSPERLALKFEFMEYAQGLLKDLAREKRPVVVCGDWNIAHTALDIHAPKRNEKNSGFLPEEREWLSKVLAMGWTDALRSLHPDVPGLYSWWSTRGQARQKDLGWRLDYLMLNKAMGGRLKSAWIEKDAGLSDHAPVWIEIED
ncbi:MAG: exodeoxyribonuclease-3 [Planctomycetota bacterium]|jgi:exodeoxyribonuclease-3